MSQPLEDILDFPERDTNNVRIDGVIYAGKIYNLQFDGPYLNGMVTFAKYAPRDNAGNASFENVYHVGSRRRETIISYGEPQTTRISGYRAAIVGELANKKIVVSSSLLDLVFASIDERMLDFYRTVFPENSSLKSFIGEITHVVGYLEDVRRRSPCELYVLKSLDGNQVCRVGLERELLEDIDNPLRVGDVVSVMFDSWETMAVRTRNAGTYLGGNFSSFPEIEVWHPIREYERLTSIQKNRAPYLD